MPVGSNTFTGGLNTDHDINTQPNSTYRDAVNIDTVDNGAFTALNNVKGTDLIGRLQTVTGLDDINILGQYEALGVFSGEEAPCIAAFVYVGGISRIYAINTRKNTVHTIFDEDDGNLNFPSGGTVDAYYNKEKGVNTIYFVDNSNEFRKVVINDGITQTLNDLAVRPLASADILTFVELQGGGTLESGTYQFAYRYVKLGTSDASAWSSPINPIPIIPQELSEVTDPDQVVGGIVTQGTGKAIKLSLGLTPENAGLFNAVELAVIRNTTGSLTAEITADVLSASTDYYNDPTNILYTGTENSISTPIEDIVVEDISLLTAKTIEQKDNRLFLGNITLNDLTIGDDEGTFTGAKTIANEADNSYKEVNDTYATKGYFREELYRYAVVYEDRFGNSSPPKPLNFNSLRRYSQDTSFAAAVIGIVSTDTSSGGEVISTDIEVTGNFTTTLKKYDWIGRHNTETSSTDIASGQRFRLIQDSTFASGNTTVTVAGDASIASGIYLLRLIGDEGNCIAEGSASIDWKFPERSVSKFSILNENDQATRLGIRIEGITNHPSWAVSMRIVRLPREKNILFQTLHVPGVAYQGVPSPGKVLSTNNDLNGPAVDLGDSGTSLSPEDFAARVGIIAANDSNVSNTGDFVGSNQFDFIGPKLFRLGAAKNLVRCVRKGRTLGLYAGNKVATPAWSTAMGKKGTITLNGIALNNANGSGVGITNQEPGGFSTFRGVCPAIFATPPEYVANNNGDPFAEYTHSASQQVHVVDAVVLKSKPKVSTDTSAAEADIYPIDSSHYSRATVYQAIENSHYFYNRQGVGKLEGSDQFYYTRITDTEPFALGVAKEFIRISRGVTQTLNSGPTTLPQAPFEGNVLFDYILGWGVGRELSQEQGSNEAITNALTPVTQYFGNPVENQRGIIMILEEALEDFTVRFGSEIIDRNIKLFPLISDGSTGQDIRNLYDETYLVQYLATNPAPALGIPMGNSVGTNRTSGLNANNKLQSAAYVLNVEVGLGDGRYGSEDNSQNYISTGFEVKITSTDQVVNADVFGGDCFVSKQVFKVNNSITRPVRFQGPTNIDTLPTLDYPLGGAFVAPIPGEFKTGSSFDDVEIVEMYIESEVNNAYSAETGVYPEQKTLSIETYNADYLQPYNPNYSQENNVKTFISRDRSVPFLANLPATVAWSDQRVPNSNIEGFDRFRTLSQKPLEEQYGEITKLVKTSDSEMWSVQEGAVRWLPIGKEVVTLDGGQSLGTVGSELVIGNTVKYLSTESGSQHIRTVKSKGDLVFYVDAEKREVNAFASMSKIETISNNGMYSFFKDVLTRSEAIPEKALMGGYDFNKKEYWVILNQWTDSVPNGAGGSTFVARNAKNAVFNDKAGAWKTLMDTGNNEVKGIVFANQELYGVATTTSAEPNKLDLNSWTFYTNNQRGKIFGEYLESEFTVISNAEPGSDKVFDVITLDSKDRVDTVDVSIEDEVSFTPKQVASNIDAFKPARDGKFYVNEIRNDTNKSRLRGQSAIERFIIKNDEDNNREVRVTAILNKFRISARNL